MRPWSNTPTVVQPVDLECSVEFSYSSRSDDYDGDDDLSDEIIFQRE